MPYLNSESSSLYYKTLGFNHPAILIHGSCLNLNMWDDLFDILAHQRLTIAYDQRGYGKSRFKSKENYSHEHDLYSLYEHLDLKKADLIGLSSGAEIAVDFCLQYPDKVSSLTLVSPALSGMDANIETREIDREILETIKTGKYNQTVQLIYNHPVFAPAISNARCNSLIREIINRHDFGAVTNNPPTIGINNAKWKLNEIKVPTLVVIGRNDSNYFHITAETLKNGIEDSQLKITEDAGHMLNMEQPHTFNQILSLFLSTH